MPRGPPEWGEVLHEPEWAGKRRWDDLTNIGFSVGIFLITTVISLLWLASWLRHEGETDLLGVITVSMWFSALVLGVPMLVVEARQMPLRVYEAGFTRGREPFLRGLMRREAILSPDRMTRIKIDTRGHGDTCGHTLELHYKDNNGRARTIKDWSLDDTAYARALARLMPEGTGRDVVRYLDEQDAARGKAPFPEEAAAYRRSTGLGAVAIFLGFVVAIPAFMGILVSEGASDIVVLVTLWVPLALVMVLIIVFVAMRMAVWTIERTIYHEAVPSGGSLVFRPPLWTTFFLSVRASLPLAEVTEVRRVTASNRTGFQGELSTASGERIKVGSALYERLALLSQFEADGDVLRNRWAGKAAGPPMVARSMPRTLATTLACIGIAGGVMYAASALAGGTGSAGGASDWMVPTIVLIIGSLVLLVAALFIGMYVVGGRLKRIAHGMVITEEAITLPNAPEALRRIPRGRISSIETTVGFTSFHTIVKTPNGSVALPLDAATKLKEKGYVVKDGLGQGRTLDMDKRWEASFEADLEHTGGYDAVPGVEAGR